MRISTRIALTRALCVGLIGIVGAVVVATNHTVRHELAKNADASEILDGVYGARYLMHEYLIGHEERALVQLRARQDSLTRLLAVPHDPAMREGEYFDRLRQANAAVESLFSQIVTNYSTENEAERSRPLFRELEERLTGQVMIRIETMISAATAVSEQSRQMVLDAQNRESIAIGAFGALVLLTFAVTMIIEVTSIFRPLATLQAGVAVLSTGDFTYRMDDSGGDEIRDLARAFNDMTTKLRNRDTKIRRLVDSNIIGIVITDLNGTILEANGAFLRIVGYTSGEDHVKQLLTDNGARMDVLTSDGRIMNQLEESLTYAPVEKDLLHLDGRRIPVMIGGALIDGDPKAIASFVLDLTERKAAQEALARTQADLTHMARVSSLGALTASIAHEVSQPLSGIVTNSSTCLRMLAAIPPNVDGVREAVQRTIRDGNRASEVITRLRAMYAKKQVPFEPVDLSEAAREVAALLHVELRQRRVTLRLDLAIDLPNAVGDRVQLQQVILNLLMNAADAMETIHERPRELTIGTSTTENGQVLLTVADNGPGIKPDEKDRVFAPFYSSKEGGMGMGLAVCRSIIQSHQGRLWVESSDGRGATFSFSLPAYVSQPLGEEEDVTIEHAWGQAN